MAYRAIPPVFGGFIDDAAVFPPGNAAVSTALDNHRRYRLSWYADLVGPLLLPVSKLSQVPDQDGPLRVGLIADTGVTELAAAVDTLPSGCVPAQIEARPSGDDDLATLRGLAERFRIPIFAEIPVISDFDVELPLLRHAGATPKFRTGGLSAELFPTPEELATAITACARQDMSFKLTAGLHQFTRHTDAATGFTHHGFGNVLAAAELAHRSESVESVTECLKIRDSTVLAERVRKMLGNQRPLWVGFGSCSIDEPLDDLSGLSLVNKEN